MSHWSWVLLDWFIGSMVIGLLWVGWRTISRLVEWSTYWHDQWLELGKLHADTVDEVEKWKGEARRFNVQLTKVCNELDGYRKEYQASVPIVWPKVTAWMVPACGGGEAVKPVSGVSAGERQCAPGEEEGGGGSEVRARYPLYAVDSATGTVRRVPGGANESVSRGPQGGGGERGEARGGESAADACGV